MAEVGIAGPTPVDLEKELTCSVSDLAEVRMWGREGWHGGQEAVRNTMAFGRSERGLKILGFILAYCVLSTRKYMLCWHALTA